MQLGGNLHKIFDIYTSDADAITNLAILTPDVLEILQHHAYQYDMEIINDIFYLYRRAEIDGDAILDIYDTANKLFLKIGRKLSTANIIVYQSAKPQSVHSDRPLELVTHERLVSGDKNFLKKIVRNIFGRIYHITLWIFGALVLYIFVATELLNKEPSDRLAAFTFVVLAACCFSYFLYRASSKIK